MKNNKLNENEEDDLIIDKTFSHSNNQLTVVSANGYNLANTKLDKNFFENLLILEMDLEDEFSKEKLFDLVKQYSIAIEYYLQHEPMKAKAYQNRMEYLLTNKDTLIQLKRQRDNLKNNNNNTENKEKNITNKSKSELIKKKEDYKFRQEDVKDHISKKLTLVLNLSENSMSGKDIINEELEKQNLNWKEKLKNKKKNPERFSVKPSIGGGRKKFQSSRKFELNLSPNSSGFSDENQKSEKISEFKTVYEELYDKEEKDEFDAIEEKKEEEKQNGDDIKENKIEEIKEEQKEEQKEQKEENNKEEDKKVEDNNKNEIIVEDKKEEIKEKENTENIDQTNEENIIIEKKTEEETKSQEINEEPPKDKNEIIELKKDEENPPTNNINASSLEKAIESSKIDSGKKLPEKTNTLRKMSLLEEEPIDNIKPDEEIKTSIESQITSLKQIISHLDKKNLSQNEADLEEEEESEFSNSNTNLVKTKSTNSSNLDKVPGRFQGAYIDIETIIAEYINDFNQFFYKEIFEQFSSGLKELYNMKYNKYIEIRNEYHAQIKENEYLLELDDNLSKEKKEEIQQTIESLKEEQQHQIDIVDDEFNQKISDKISEFKLNSFKNNSGIQLLEEKVKLEIYSLINEAFC